MANSFKHQSFSGNTTAKSEKKDKRIVNKNLRRKVNQALKDDLKKVNKHIGSTLDSFLEEEGIEIDENRLHIDKKDISNVWDFSKDGKHFIDKKSSYYKKAMRK